MTYDVRLREASEGGRIPNDERDDPGIRVPPPPVYLLALLLGLALDRKVHVPPLAERGGAHSGGRWWEAE